MIKQTVSQFYEFVGRWKAIAYVDIAVIIWLKCQTNNNKKIKYTIERK